MNRALYSTAFLGSVGMLAAVAASCDPEPGSDSPTYPTVQINPDDSPETLNVEVYNPLGTPGYSLQIHEVGGTFDDSVNGPVSEVCIPVATGAGPTFIQQIVLPATTVASSIAVFAQLYVSGADAGASTPRDATVAADADGATPQAKDATVPSDAASLDAASRSDGGADAAAMVDSGPQGACRGVPFGSSAVWPGAPTPAAEGGLADGARDSATTKDANGAKDAGSDALADAKPDAVADASADSTAGDAADAANDSGSTDAGGDQ